MKEVADFITQEKVNLDSEDYSGEDFEDDEMEAFENASADENALPIFVVEGFWGERLDKVLASLMPDVSRARLQKMIESGAVKVNGVVV